MLGKQLTEQDNYDMTSFSEFILSSNSFSPSFCSLFLGAMMPVFSIVFSEMIGLYYQPKEEIEDEARWWALGFVGIGAVPLVFNTLQSWMFAFVAENMTKRIRAMTFKVIT